MTDTARRRRLFFALWPSPETAASLARDGARIAAQVKGRPMRADSLHVTLAFLGEVERSVESDLIAACDQLDLSHWADGFRIRLDRLEHWRHNGIIAATSSARAESTRQLAALLGDLSRSCAIDLPDRPFVPHLTLVRNSRVPLPLELGELEPRQILTHAFRLVCSRLDPSGSRYQPVGIWAVGGSQQPASEW